MPALLTLVGFAFLMGLGNWQLNRKTWKESIVASMEARALVPPLSHEDTMKLRCSMVDSVGLDASCEYRRVRVKGVFDHDKERHIFAGVQNMGAGPTPGYWVFTPFWPAGTNREARDARPILVNRGFVPEAFKAPETRTEGQTPGEVEIVAQIRTRETRKWYDNQNMPEKNIYFVREPRELGIRYPKQRNDVLVLGVGYFYLEVVEGEPKGGLPKPLAGVVKLTNRHLEYALTWFGLAATLLAVFAAFAWTRLRPPSE